MTRTRRFGWAAAVVLALATALRLFRLDGLPPAVFRDEAEKAYTAWLLLHTGADAEGRPWPVFIKVFGVTTSAAYQYVTMLFQAVGGLNNTTTRLPAAVAGMGAVAMVLLGARRAWGRQAAVWAAVFLAISPWHVPLTRWAQQGSFLPLLLGVAFYGVVRFGRGRGAAGWLCGAAAALGAAVYVYDVARLFVPLWLLAAAWVWRRELACRWRQVALAAGVFVLVASPTVYLVLFESGASQARFRFLSVWQPGTEFLEGAGKFLANYASHFSPRFLIVAGDAELRHSGGVGMANLAELAMAGAGAVFAVRRRNRYGLFVLLWVLVAPMPASLTREGVPHALRCIVMLPGLQLLAGYGAAQVLRARPLWRWKAAALAGATLAGAVPFVVSYYGSSYAKRSAFNWQYGVSEGLMYMSNPGTREAKVLLHNIVGAEYLVPYYLKMAPAEYRRFIRGQTRYGMMAFQPYGRPAPAVPGGPAAFLTPPGYDWAPTMTAVPITAPGDEGGPPVALVVMNRELFDRVKAAQ